MIISDVLAKQREFYKNQNTKSYSFRKNALDKLHQCIIKNTNKISDALYSDLNKPPVESYMTEIGMVLDEISYAKKNLKKWMKPKKVKTPFSQFPAKSFILNQSLGSVLIMSPWNYPFMLSLCPLVGALAAGNCVIIKPSAYSSATSAIIKKIINFVFDENYVAVVEGGRLENTALLEEKFDYIFFTGSAAVGKTVMEYASKNLTPITLELGGKSPCIVDKPANHDLGAKRLVFGKFLNAGQTCVAPDYLLVQKDVKDQLLSYIKKYILKFFGENSQNSADYTKIINSHHFSRIASLIENEEKTNIYFGGNFNSDTLKISPTVIINQTFASKLMEDEIFGPILPVLTFDSINETIFEINKRATPLALYLFTTNKQTENKILSQISFGGGCVNDTIIHLATNKMPFGGVGESGMGRYHGKFSFDTFSHKKSILKKSNLIDLPFRYRPYTEKNMNIIKKFMK
ncbi:MAG: aldehyde dehydrogenase [Clostridia bacterium]